MDKDFICCKCKKRLNESFSFGGYGHEKARYEQIKNNNYCEKHFDARYEEIFGEKPMKDISCEENKSI